MSTINSNGQNNDRSLADELKLESERLQQLAKELKKREEADAEMRANYPYFKEFVYARLREQFDKELPELPDDLEAYAKEVGAVPLTEEFLKEIVGVNQRS
ncbi:MAG: hypothetical protein L0Y72_24440 [Gemmataceae bacterium]|nr:hypothetical protein [Gemmataceae bacterium]MCI0742195.1 hypothetical protein [Gemmataceae bacterium]